MSADSFHHGAEKQMTREPGGNSNVYDFSDFVDVVAKSNAGNVDVIVLESADVYAWVGGHSQAGVKSGGATLADMVQIQVRQGSHKMYFMVDHDADEFETLDLHQEDIQSRGPNHSKRGMSGVDACKNADIISKLCSLMPETRRSSWRDLAENDDAGNIDE